MNRQVSVQPLTSRPADFQDNESGYHDSFSSGKRDYRPPMAKPIDFRVYAVWAIAGLLGFLVFFAVYSLWKWVYCMAPERYNTCQTLSASEPIAFGLLLFIPVALVALNVCLKIWTRTRYENALANQANLARNRFGDNEPADFFDRISPQMVVEILADRYLQANNLETVIAKHKLYRGVNSLSLSNTTNNESNLLEGPEARLEAMPPDRWLPIANDKPHTMIAGSTGEGKTITAKAILLPRLQANEPIFVIDPHSSNWFGIAGRAGGEDWADCVEAITDVFLEYKDRITQRHQYLLVTGQEMPENHFPRLNVLVDEAFLIKENLDIGTSKKQMNYWTLLAEIMSSGARKIGISLILLTQTANVEDLGISGPLRRNFFRIAIDAPSIRLMIAREETDHERKQQLYEAMIGLQYPATAEIGGQIHLLDRQGLMPMAQTHVDGKQNLWLPPAGRSFVRNGQNPHNDAPGRTNERTNGNIINTLVTLRRQGITRDRARSEHGLSFTDGDWTIAGEIIDNAP